ncbi:MAG: hypothetical protein CME38_14050 [Haliea sp.]|jgi:ParB/RepB/Spo0J family partition protein|nr:hypothetical protein [Haliea sp.]|tara:strand:- start:4163 stop:5335 length:1173 start_codon:yes stop_codon:yes gene_type:complete
MGSGFSFDDMLNNDSQAGVKQKSTIKVNSIKKYEFNRDLSSDDALEKINELREQLEATDWQLVQPITVQKINDSEYDYLLIAGERRLTAFELGNQVEIEANVFEVDHFSAQQLRELNLVENEQREDEDLFSRALRYKAYIDEFNVSSKDAAKKLGVESAKFSKLTNHIVDLMDFEPVKTLYFDKGVRDILLLSALIQIGKKNNKALKTLVSFCEANNCLNRKFVLDAKKLCDLYDDLELESNLKKLYLGESFQQVPTTATNTSSKEPKDNVGVLSSDTEHSDSGSSAGSSDNSDSIEEDQFELESEQDGVDKAEQNDSQSNSVFVDGHEVLNKKITQICVDYEGEKYNIDLSQYVPQKDGEDDFIVGIHFVSKERKVLLASKCTLSFAAA